MNPLLSNICTGHNMIIRKTKTFKLWYEYLYYKFFSLLRDFDDLEQIERILIRWNLNRNLRVLPIVI